MSGLSNAWKPFLLGCLLLGIALFLCGLFWHHVFWRYRISKNGQPENQQESIQLIKKPFKPVILE